jgi:nitrous oxide reductase
MERRIRTLKDEDISSRRNVSRRALLHTLGIGAAAAAAAAGSAIAQTQPKPRDPCRDRDHGPSDQDGCGRPTS